MGILQDRPELDAIAGHQRKGALDRPEGSEGGEFLEQIEHTGAAGRAGDLANSVQLCVTKRRSRRE
jgi:hypothetical protein